MSSPSGLTMEYKSLSEFALNKNCRVKNWKAAWAGVAQWIKHRPVTQRVASSIPSRHT